MAGTTTPSYTASYASFVGLLAVWPCIYGGLAGSSVSARAVLSIIVSVTSLSPLLAWSVSCQVTAVPSALAVPVILAEPATTLTFGSAKVQVGITFQFVKGSGNVPVGFPPASTISLSFSNWPKSILNRPFEAVTSTGGGAEATDRMIIPLMPPELSSISANQRYSPALTLTVTVLGCPKGTATPLAFTPE